MFSQYDEADLPITRNQEFVMRNLKLDDEHLALLTNTANDLEKVSPKLLKGNT